jgi:solute carrier family 20 (sodium-dependent phosphate transporter)
VSDTISGGVANPDAFKAVPDVFAYGMLCAVTAAAVWLLFATYYELPVSTTHSIVGGVMGFALVYGAVPRALRAGRRVPRGGSPRPLGFQPCPLTPPAAAGRGPSLPPHHPRSRARAGGAGAVIWNKKINEFPFVSGVVAIVISWFASPLVAGLISFTLFWLVRVAVLRSKDSVTRAIWCLPILLMITVFVK